MIRTLAMRRRLASTCAVLATIGFLFPLTACSRDEPVPADLDVRVGFGLAAGSTRAHAQRLFLAHLQSDTLIAIDSSGRPSGRIAATWEWQDEGRALAIRLREGVKLHSGQNVNSEHVVAALKRRSASTSSFDGFRHLLSIEALDETTVLVRLKHPDVFLIDELANTSIISGDQGTGPFRSLPSDPMVVERFEQYFDGPPAVRRIALVPFDTQRSAWAALMRGEIDALQEVDRDAVEFLEGSTQVKTYTSRRPFYIALLFNTRHPALQDVRVRRALAEAVDRDEIIRDALRGYAEPAVDPVWPAHWAYSGAARQHAHDPDSARALLDNAGFPVRPRQGPGMERRMQLTCLFPSTEPQFERIALMLQRQLARVGIELLMKGLPLDEAVRSAGTGDFEVLLMPHGSGTTLAGTYRFWRSRDEGAMLNSGYTGADIILDAARLARTDSEVRAVIADLQQRFYEDVPAVFLAWQLTTRAVDARIDVGDDGQGDVFANIRRWRPAGPARRAGR